VLGEPKRRSWRRRAENNEDLVARRSLEYRARQFCRQHPARWQRPRHGDSQDVARLGPARAPQRS